MIEGIEFTQGCEFETPHTEHIYPGVDGDRMASIVLYTAYSIHTSSYTTSLLSPTHPLKQLVSTRQNNRG